VILLATRRHGQRGLHRERFVRDVFPKITTRIDAELGNPLDVDGLELVEMAHHALELPRERGGLRVVDGHPGQLGEIATNLGRHGRHAASLTNWCLGRRAARAASPRRSPAGNAQGVTVERGGVGPAFRDTVAKPR